MRIHAKYHIYIYDIQNTDYIYIYVYYQYVLEICHLRCPENGTCGAHRSTVDMQEIATKTSAAETDAVSARVSTASNAIQRPGWA